MKNPQFFFLCNLDMSKYWSLLLCLMIVGPVWPREDVMLRESKRWRRKGAYIISTVRSRVCAVWGGQRNKTTNHKWRIFMWIWQNRLLSPCLNRWESFQFIASFEYASSFAPWKTAEIQMSFTSQEALTTTKRDPSIYSFVASLPLEKRREFGGDASWPALVRPWVNAKTL